MQKILTLDLDELYSEYVTSDYDIGGKGHEMTVEFTDKKDFLKEIARNFIDRVKDLLETKFVCDCGEEHCDSESIYRCRKCHIEICDECSNDDLCNECS